MRYGIVVDSSCDIKEPGTIINDEIGFARAPLTIDMDGSIITDEMDLDTVQFMADMKACKGKIGSGAPSPERWLTAFNEHETIFAITVTGALSGSYASAQAAKDMALEQEPDKKICIIDSKSAGPGVTILVMKLKEFIKAGFSYEEITQKIMEYMENTHLVFAFGSMDNLIKNGRVGKLQGGMAGLLGIKLVAHGSKDGKIEILHKCRGKKMSYDKLLQEMKKNGFKGGRVVISHCFNEEGAEYIRNKIEECMTKDCEFVIMPTSGLCCLYAELGGVLVSYES